MANLQQSASGKKDGDIRYLTPLNIETNKTKKYCRFKKSGFYHLFEFNVPGEVLIAFETEFRRDERVMRFLTVSLDKHAISWAERRRAKLKSQKA